MDFQDSRYIGACGAVWRTLCLSTGAMYPPVERLDLHLLGGEAVFVQADEELEQRRLYEPQKTRLAACFDCVRDHPEDALAQTLRNVDSSEHWHGVQKRWTRRKTQQFSVASLLTASTYTRSAFARLLVAIGFAKRSTDATSVHMRNERAHV